MNTCMHFIDRLKHVALMMIADFLYLCIILSFVFIILIMHIHCFMFLFYLSKVIKVFAIPNVITICYKHFKFE